MGDRIAKSLERVTMRLSDLRPHRYAAAPAHIHTRNLKFCHLPRRVANPVTITVTEKPVSFLDSWGYGIRIRETEVVHVFHVR